MGIRLKIQLVDGGKVFTSLDIVQGSVSLELPHSAAISNLVLTLEGGIPISNCQTAL